ncbi:MAG: cyclic pyranopterin monophosphate synthase MoaC [Clostridia bacterium]
MGEFTHFNQHGDAIMVDISKKAETAREAIAEGRISMNQECFDQLKVGSIGKGDVLGVARIAGIMGAKKTSELIPLCHLLSLTKAEIDFELENETCSVRTICTVRTTGKTGVEMEALTGVQIALLTIYDMCKAVDKGMEMNGIHLCQKSGGKSGIYIRKAKQEV